jgi:HEAT repeat protein
MPLVRKPSSQTSVAAAPATLGEGTSDQRWSAVRAATDRPDALELLADALSREDDPRVREAIFTALARLATPESAAVVVTYLRSDDANLRTGAIDALRAMPQVCRHYLPALLADSDADVRLLSCELARGLPDEEANRLLCDLLERETEKNVCAAVIEVLTEIGRPEALPSLVRCGTRFAGDPFIAFSLKVATERIAAPARDRR